MAGCPRPSPPSAAAGSPPSTSTLSRSEGRLTDAFWRRRSWRPRSTTGRIRWPRGWPSRPPWPGATPAAAQERLRRFAADALAGYDRSRDLPADTDGTSRLSAALKLGTLSVRDAARAALRRAAADARARTGGERFIRQLAWRDYAAHLLQAHPDLLRRPLRQPPWAAGAAGLTPEAERARLQAWVDGRTGLPLVDAGMRQLLGEGWMPDRVRMLSASLLAHQMGCDWRIGEQHFVGYLVDLDLASNDMGWQWAVGVGVDPPPNRRTFNPRRQGEEFDPAGDYVRRWVPELAGVPTSHIHHPWTMSQVMQAGARCLIGIDYPEPVVPPAMPRGKVS